MIEEKDIVKIDEELLLKIFRISSPSNKEEKAKTFIKSFLSENLIDFNTDALGNIFCLKHENAPLLSAHMDTVEDENDSALMQYVRIFDNPTYGKYLRGYGVIGGDDKCGIFIALSLLRKHKNKLNFIFSINEEKGMTGIQSVVNSQDFSKVLYGIVIDRRGAGDIICVDNSYGSKEFEAALKKVGEPYGFKPARGSCSDANHIRNKVSCANLSSGYYNPHSKKEFVILDDVQNSMDYIDSIVSTITEKFAAPTVVERTYDYSYVSCKLCYKSESRDKIKVRYSLELKSYLCTDCAKKIITAAKDPYLMSFVRETYPNFLLEKETQIPISTY